AASLAISGGARAQPGVAPGSDAAARDAAVRAAIEAERAALLALGELPEEAEEACDRDCLDSVARAYLESVQTGDLSGMVLAQRVRVTEDGRQIQPGEGYWRRGGTLLQHRLNILDED